MLGNLAEVVTKENIEKAIKEIIEGNIQLIPSTKFDLVFQGKRLPPKEVVRIAAKIQGIKDDEDYRLSGGENTNRYLREKGFNIQPKSNNNFSTMIPSSKVPELKRLWSDFKNDAFYLERQAQLIFVPWAKSVIEETLKQTLTNEKISTLLQVFDVRLKNIEVIKRYLPENIKDSVKREQLERLYKKNEQVGFTTSPVRTIPQKQRLDKNELLAVQSLLQKSLKVNSVNEAIEIVDDYEKSHVKLITHKLYSPWLYYSNPDIFPIKNSSNDTFIEWCEQPIDSYPNTIKLYHEVSEILGEKDLGLIDSFTHYFDIDQNSNSYNQNNNANMALNTILYGPPGTGKTYVTIEKAVEITNPEFKIDSYNRQSLQAEYKRLVKEGQIEFVTFHQGMSYEDFIEGIKPMEPHEGDQFLKYEIKEGIFKRLCERAAKVPDAQPGKFSISNDEFEKAGFYKLSLGDTSNPDDDLIYTWCIENGYIALGWGDANDFSGLNENGIQLLVPVKLEKFAAQSVNYFIHYLKIGDYVVVTYGNLQFRAIGRITGNYEFKNVEGLSVHQFRKVEWLIKDVELPYEEVYNKQFSQQSIYRLNKREIKRDFFVKVTKGKMEDNKLKNYVLIIDEINRGNVSQIFGELITLIEANKRAGNKEELSSLLPYSNKYFTVPSNLFIIGTMNTADRSVEALDTALRRRFIFEEMMPQTELLNPRSVICRFWNEPKYSEVGWEEDPYLKESEDLYTMLGIDRNFEENVIKLFEDEDRDWIESDFNSIKDSDFTGIRLDILLATINKRMERLLSRDNCIGHSYFLNVYSVKDLMERFKNEIIPLLQEYFYGDYGKMCLVLGKGFVDIDPDKSGDDEKYFANADHDFIDSFLEKKVWKIKTPKTEDEFLNAIETLLNK